MANTILLGSTVFLSAFLLFLIQPIAAKAMLPAFGGTSAVWVTSLVFFQTALLLGYTYADRLSAWLETRNRARLHIAFLLASTFFIPLQILEPAYQATPSESPISGVLFLLGSTLGLPYLLLSSTGPLLQAVHYRRFPKRNVYRLYAMSNLASLAALFAYPFTVERMWPVEMQLKIWSGAYILFALLCGSILWMYNRPMAAGSMPIHLQPPTRENASLQKPIARAEEPPSLLEETRWLGFSALGSALLVSTTSHITQNIASIPLFWVLPLGVYLLSFVITFDNARWYAPRLAVVPVIFAPLLMMLTAFADADRMSFMSMLAINTAGLLVCCWFLHGELSRRKPPPQYLTRFYLILSAGGALGGASASIATPWLLNGFYEYRALLVLFSLISVVSLWPFLTRNALSKAILGVFMLCVAAGASMAAWSIRADQKGQIASLRNFYAVTMVKEQTGSDGKTQRVLYNGSIRHGSQYLFPEALQSLAGDYYGESSGVGKLMDARDASPSRVGVIGLGAGVMAAYARKTDHFTFFEINPQSIQVARTQFSYLTNAKSRVDIVQGDARIELQKQRSAGQGPSYDILVVDAFSGDAIPVHLLTQEALALYLSQLVPDGVLAIHISNKYLDLRPVVSALAESLGLHARSFISKVKKGHEFSSNWLLLTRSAGGIRTRPWYSEGRMLSKLPGESDRYLWTDLNNNLFDVLILGH